MQHYKMPQSIPRLWILLFSQPGLLLKYRATVHPGLTQRMDWSDGASTDGYVPRPVVCSCVTLLATSRGARYLQTYTERMDWSEGASDGGHIPRPAYASCDTFLATSHQHGRTTHFYSVL